MIEPDYQCGDVTLYRGDCLEILPELDRASIAAVVSDPPYGMNWDCDYTRFVVGPNGHGDGSTQKFEQIHNDDKPFDPAPFLDFERVVLFGYHHFAQRLPNGSVLVWIKRKDGGFGSFLSDADLAWMKGGCGVYCKRDTSLLGETRNRLHATQKPVKLMQWCLDMAKVPIGATVLDPFAGSGSTGVACIQTGRKFIGIEIDPGYYAVAQMRLHECQMQQRMELVS